MALALWHTFSEIHTHTEHIIYVLYVCSLHDDFSYFKWLLFGEEWQIFAFDVAFHVFGSHILPLNTFQRNKNNKGFFYANEQINNTIAAYRFLMHHAPSHAQL